MVFFVTFGLGSCHSTKTDQSDYHALPANHPMHNGSNESSTISPYAFTVENVGDGVVVSELAYDNAISTPHVVVRRQSDGLPFSADVEHEYVDKLPVGQKVRLLRRYFMQTDNLSGQIFYAQPIGPPPPPPHVEYKQPQ